MVVIWYVTFSVCTVSLCFGFGTVLQSSAGHGPFMASKWALPITALDRPPLHASLLMHPSFFKSPVINRLIKSLDEEEARKLRILKAYIDKKLQSMYPTTRVSTARVSTTTDMQLTPDQQKDEHSKAAPAGVVIPLHVVSRALEETAMKNVASQTEDKRGTWFALAEARRRTQAVFDLLRTTTVAEVGAPGNSRPSRKLLNASPRVG